MKSVLSDFITDNLYAMLSMSGWPKLGKTANLLDDFSGRISEIVNLAVRPLLSPFAPSFLTAYRSVSVIIKASAHLFERCAPMWCGCDGFCWDGWDGIVAREWDGSWLAYTYENSIIIYICFVGWKLVAMVSPPPENMRSTATAEPKHLTQWASPQKKKEIEILPGIERTSVARR